MHTREPKDDFLLLRKLLKKSLCLYFTDQINDLIVVKLRFITQLNSQLNACYIKKYNRNISLK